MIVRHLTVLSFNQTVSVLDEKTGETSQKTTTGTIKKIAQAVIDGTSHYYIVLNESDLIYDVDISKHLDTILLEAGDKVTIKYTEGTPATVIEIQKQ